MIRSVCMATEIIGSIKLDYYINNPRACIIDVRSKEEYECSRIRGALSYCYDALMSDINNGRLSLDVFKDKSFVYVLYCDKGLASMIACDKLSNLGYNCKSLVGGFDGYKGKQLIK